MISTNVSTKQHWWHQFTIHALCGGSDIWWKDQNQPKGLVGCWVRSPNESKIQKNIGRLFSAWNLCLSFDAKAYFFAGIYLKWSALTFKGISCKVSQKTLSPANTEKVLHLLTRLSFFWNCQKPLSFSFFKKLNFLLLFIFWSSQTHSRWTLLCRHW